MSGPDSDAVSRERQHRAFTTNLAFTTNNSTGNNQRNSGGPHNTQDHSGSNNLSGSVHSDDLDAGGYLLGPDGSGLKRTLGKDDNELRRCMVDSILHAENWDVLNVLEQDGSRWLATNLGKTFVSNQAVHNLFAAVPAQNLGLGTVMCVGGESYMVNAKGDRFPLRRHGKQLRFEALLADKFGSYRRVQFVHDSGASANILKDADSKVWSEQGDGIVFMGGFVGGEHKLVGGNDLKVFLRVSDTKSSINDDLTMSSVLEQISLVEMGVSDADPVAIRDGDLSDATNDEVGSSWLDDLGAEIAPGSRQGVLGRVASAKALESAIDKDTKEANNKSKGALTDVSRGLGIIRRMQEMERAAEIYPHMSTSGLNRMVRDGYLPHGIEYHARAKLQDEATLIGRGTKPKLRKKRTPGVASESGFGYRAPFFVTFGDLVDLSAETGNRWGYRYILTLMCKEHGIAKVYPITGKSGGRGGSSSNG